MSLLKFYRKLKYSFKYLLIHLIAICSLSILTINNANAAGGLYTTPTAGCYTNYWVEPASNSTMFDPTVTVYYDQLFGYIGYKGNITLSSTGDNCGYIENTRFCARIANLDTHNNSFACSDSQGDSCQSTSISCTTPSASTTCSTFGTSTTCVTPYTSTTCSTSGATTNCTLTNLTSGSTGSCSIADSSNNTNNTCSISDSASNTTTTCTATSNNCGSTCTPGDTYYCMSYGNQNNTPYTCNSGSYYNCNCPDCRNVCAMRLCVYQDPSENESFIEECDDVYGCMDGTGSNAYMPYFENTTVAYNGLFGVTYFNTDGGTFVGCVDIPIGPYPPPYCDPMIGTAPSPSTMNICEYSPEYELSQTSDDSNEAGNYYQVSTSTNVCELSTATLTPNSSAPVYSTFEEPLVRLYYNNALNICSSNYVEPTPAPTPGNDTCVKISSNISPQDIWQDDESLIPVCSSDVDASTENCVVFPSGRTTGPAYSSTAFPNGGSSYFRTYFNEPTSSTPTTQLPYGSDIASELSLYGIYDSLFYDIGDLSGASSSTYSYTNEYGITKNYGTVYVDDYEGNTRTFGAFIDLGFDPYINADSTGIGNGTQLCIDEIITTATPPATPIGCFDRPWLFTTSPPLAEPTAGAPSTNNPNGSYSSVVSPCLTYDTCSYASSVNISQQPRISVTLGRSFVNPQGKQVNPVTGVIGVDLLSNSAPVSFCVLDDNHTTAQQASNSTSNPTNLSPCTIYQSNLYGAYITDDINYSISSDPSATNGTKTPYSTGQQYTGGMQYVDYVYCRGASQICLSGYDNPLKTVVTKMVAMTTTTTNSDGTTTTTTGNPFPSTILTDRIIPPYVIGETYPLQNSQLYNPAINNYTASTTSTQTSVQMGYYDTTNDVYVAYPGCTSSSNMTCCVSTTSSGTAECTNSTNITYPAPLLCTCTNSLGETESCGTESASCTYAFETTQTVQGQATGYQIAGNYTTYTTANDDDMSSPWTNCTYDSTTKSTICPATDNYGNALFGVRELTPMELGLCVDLLAPYCDAIDSTDGYTEANGYATWPQTSAGSTATGTCTNGAKQSNAGPPTRTCAYVDTTSNGQPVLYPNGCPEYSQAWQTITNPCVVSPPWWPGSFLAGGSDSANSYAGNYLGAIINQFSVSYDYRSAVSPTKYLTPYSSNADPFNLYSGSYNTQYSSSSVVTNSNTTTPILPEPWNSCYWSCKKDGAGTTTNYARTKYDGDQEMLYLTQDQWYDLWNYNDMEWLLASPDTSTNDGCYVYSLCTAFNSSGDCTTANINASFAGITPAMKICKYQDNISFALVDLGKCTANCSSIGSTTSYTNPVDYTNDYYLMQSNIIAYNAYISSTSNVSVHSWCESSDLDTITNSTNLSNNISNKTSIYDTRVNNGIVVNRTGFGFTSSDYDNNGQLPSGFVQCNAEKCGSCTSGSCTYQESVTMKYNFDHYYMGSYSEYDSLGIKTGTGHSTCNNYNPTDTVGGSGVSDTQSGSMNTYASNTNNYYSTVNPLAIFRNNITLSSTVNASSYLLNASNFTDSGYYYTPNYTSIWLPKDCNQSTESDYCNLSIVISNYTAGNSAANTAMFYWESPTSYNVTNGTVSYGSYGQPLE